MRALVATARTALAEARSNRAALWTQMLVMAFNDAIWIVFWLLFFRQVGTVRGWDMELMILLQAVLTTAGGLSLGLLANARRLGTMAVQGELDAVLSLPVPPLAYLLLRRVEPVNLGDVVFGLGLFAVLGSPTVERTIIFAATVIAAATLLTSFLVLTGSAAFFVGSNDVGEAGFHSMLVLCNYPVDIFSGMARVLVHWVVPAAFVAAVPARLIESFDAGDALTMAAVAASVAVAARTAFTLGLRRYASGSIWTRA